MIKIIQITDTHLCPPGRTIVGLDPAERLRTVVRSININHRDAAFCVITGDLTDQGEAGAYARFAESIADLSVPVHLLLGNHDARRPFRSTFPQAPVDENGYVQMSLDVSGISFLMLDTLDEERPGEGLLCPARLAWLAARLDRASGRPVVIFMHHPPFSIGLRWFDGMLLSNGAELMTLLSHHRNVLHLAFGHVHVNASGVRHGVSFSGSRGTCHKILSDPQAMQAEYVDQGPAYDILLIDADGVCVHTIDPAGPNNLIAREYPTADGRGSFEIIPSARVQRWM
jgi:3',5'-cyclic-AMP phosphodiesterase